ncbi:MAG: PA14 domain-containing protein [bacterium]
MAHPADARRRCALLLSVVTGMASLWPMPHIGATGWKPNVRKGSDIVMKDHRWPAWDQGTYYCFWYMSFVPRHPRLGSFYGGIAVSGPKKAPGMFMTYWGEVSNVHEGPLFYSHGYGAEGASGGAHGDALFLRPGAWYRFVMRVFPPATHSDDHAFVGWWVKDLDKNEWHTHSVVRVPARATGFAGNSGFVEALGPASVHRAFERRLGYCRLHGAWHKADTVSTGGAKFFKLIEDDTVLRYDRAEPDSPHNKPGRFVTTQPDEPQLDRPEISDASAVAYGRQVAVTWPIPKSASPQLGYRLEVFDSPRAEGEPMARHEANAPHILARRVDTPREAKSARLTVTDIFDQQASVTIPVQQTTLQPAAEAAGVRPGLEYAYYEAPPKTLWEKLPDFAALEAAKEGRVRGLDDTVRENREKLYALRYSGYLRAPGDGLYVFSYGTCDGSRMRLDGEVVADNDGIHSRSPREHLVALERGLHPFELLYFKGPGRRHHGGLPDRISIRWEGPGFGLRRLTQADFLCPDHGHRPSLALALQTAVTDGVTEDNRVKIRATPQMRGHRLEKLQLYSGNMLLESAGRADLSGEGNLVFQALFPAGANRVWARLWYDGHHSVDADNLLEFETRDHSEGPWKFIRLGHEFPLAARYKDGTFSFSGEGMCVGWQKVQGDFVLTGHIAEITLTSPKTGVYDQNWLGLYASNVNQMRKDAGLESTFDRWGFGVFRTAGRGMKGWCDNEDFPGLRMCFSRFPADHRWLKLERRGTRLSSFTSADGKAWQKAMDVIFHHRTEEQYAGVVFRAVPGKGKGLFQGSMDQVALNVGDVPQEVRPKIRPGDRGDRKRITAAVQAQKDSDILFARSPTEGLFKSEDHGETWKAVNRGLDSPAAMAVRSVAVHPQNSALVLRAGGRVVGGSLRSGLWRSADGGNTWTLVSREVDFDGRGPTTVFGEVVAFCRQDPDLAVAAGETKGLFVSRDTGKTWRRAGLAGQRITCLRFARWPSKPQLRVGTFADSEFAALGLEEPAAPAPGPGRIYWVEFGKNGKAQFSKRCEHPDLGFTNIGHGEWVNFGTFATTRGVYYTWTHGRTLSQRPVEMPGGMLYTALGSRPFRHGPPSVPREQWRAWCTTYAVPFSGARSLAVYAARKRTQNDWHLLSPATPRVEDDGARFPLHEGVSCILIDKDDSKTFFLCNRHGVFKTTDLGKSYRLVLTIR